MWSALLPTICPVFPCANVGPQVLLVVRLPAPFVPHSASLGPATATRVLSTQVPVSAPPTGLDECLFFLFPWCWTSLPFDFLSVLVVRGCAVCLPMPPSWFSHAAVFFTLNLKHPQPFIAKYFIFLLYILGPLQSSILLVFKYHALQKGARIHWICVWFQVWSRQYSR